MLDRDIGRFAQQYSQVAILFDFAMLQCHSSAISVARSCRGGSAAAGIWDRHQGKPGVASLPADGQAPPLAQLCEAQ
jgi:hypothetical protein